MFVNKGKINTSRFLCRIIISRKASISYGNPPAPPPPPPIRPPISINFEKIELPLPFMKGLGVPTIAP